MRWLRGPGLLARLALALALVGLLPVGFAIRSLVGINQSALIEQAESLHLVAARTTAHQITLFLDSRLALAVSLAGDDALADPRSLQARQALSRSLSAWHGLGIEGLVVVSPEGEEAIRAQLADPLPRQRVAEGVRPPPGAQFLLLSSEGGAPVVRLQAELATGAGLLWLICDGTEIGAALDAYELGEQADLMLVGRGRKALIGDQELVDDFPDQIVDEVLDKGLTGAKTDFVSQRDGRQFIGAWATVPRAEWAVFSRQPLVVAQRVEQRMWRRSLWAVGGALALIALMSVVAYLSVIRPIREVAAAQRRLAGLPGGGGSGSEIGQLRAAFAALERRLSDQERLDEVFLGRYQVSDVIGSGAMGTVFRGWDPKLKRPVALKTVRLDTKLGKRQRRELVERLLTEAVTVARFNHPNIVAVFDVEDHPEGAYVAMELVDGDSLDLMIWQGQRMPAAQVVPLGAAIARALAAAHQHGIVHRDIKPANVLLGRDGSIKVTDFGISELLSSLAPRDDVVFGTPGFVPPETLRGKGYDQAGDLFSLGAVLYTCLVGRPPFDGKTVKEVVRRTLYGTFEPPGELVPGVSSELDTLIMALLSRDLEQRPADAAEVAEQLEELRRRHDFRWQAPPAVGERASLDDSQQESRWLPTTRLEEERP